MKRIAFLAVLLAISPVIFTGYSYAQTPAAPAPSVSEDDELKIEEEMAKEKKTKKKPVTKEELPPFKMVFVKGGCYQMGDFTGEGDDDERPAHEVCVSDFYISETEVTQELFEKVMEVSPNKFYNPKGTNDPKDPVSFLSWHRANDFINGLNKITGGFYRLPTEAEWEYAARSGGKKDKWAGTNNEGELGDHAWFEDNSDMKPQKVRGKKPNSLGIYDMSGGVWEWLEDNFDFDYYQTSPKKDPYGPEFSQYRSVRGGSFADNPSKLRTTYRYALEPSKRLLNVGIRIAE